MLKIAIDVMGGDLGADASIAGLDYFLSNYGDSSSGVFFRLFGDSSKINKLLKKFPRISPDIYEIRDTMDCVISSDMKPSIAIRKCKGTSMFEAISSVASKESDAVVSSGNTGAYMALSKIVLKMIDDIERPAIVGIFPTKTGKCVMLDLGANAECSFENLEQFAIMGAASAKVLLGIKSPRIGILNIGTEKTKGTEQVKSAFDLLSSNKSMNFQGFVEGTDIPNGLVDVIVTDGFSGNIALKTMEGAIKYLLFLLKKEIQASLLAKIGYLFLRKGFSNIKKEIDPSSHNGAVFVGLQGIAVKSHGCSDPIGFASAISVAVSLAKSNFVSNITKVISNKEKENLE